jgi:putative endonuclease
MRDYNFFVYIVASDSGTLYTGVTNNLKRRIWEHKNGFFEGFSKKYKCHKLIFMERFQYVKDAIVAEKRIKGWSRKKKEDLIGIKNPCWKDLSVGL